MYFLKKLFSSNEMKTSLNYLKELDYKYNKRHNDPFWYIIKTLEQILLDSPSEFIKSLSIWRSIKCTINLETCDLIKKTILNWNFIFAEWLTEEEWWIDLLNIYNELIEQIINSWCISESELDNDTISFFKLIEKKRLLLWHNDIDYEFYPDMEYYFENLDNTYYFSKNRLGKLYNAAIFDEFSKNGFFYLEWSKNIDLFFWRLNIDSKYELINNNNKYYYFINWRKINQYWLDEAEELKYWWEAIIKLNDKYNIINFEWKLILDEWCDKIYDYYVDDFDLENIHWVTNFKNNNTFFLYKYLLIKNNKVNLIYFDNNQLISDRFFDRIELYSSHDLVNYIIVEDNWKYNIFYSDFVKTYWYIFDKWFDDIEVINIDKHWDPNKWEFEIYSSYNEYFIVNYNGKYNIINFEWKELLPDYVDKISKVSHYKWYWIYEVFLNNKYNYVNALWEYLSSDWFSNIKDLHSLLNEKKYFSEEELAILEEKYTFDRSINHLILDYNIISNIKYFSLNKYSDYYTVDEFWDTNIDYNFQKIINKIEHISWYFKYIIQYINKSGINPKDLHLYKIFSRNNKVENFLKTLLFILDNYELWKLDKQDLNGFYISSSNLYKFYISEKVVRFYWLILNIHNLFNIHLDKNIKNNYINIIKKYLSEYWKSELSSWEKYNDIIYSSIYEELLYWNNITFDKEFNIKS